MLPYIYMHSVQSHYTSILQSYSFGYILDKTYEEKRHRYESIYNEHRLPITGKYIIYQENVINT